MGLLVTTILSMPVNTKSETGVNNFALGRSRLGLISILGLVLFSAAAVGGIRYEIGGVDSSVLKVVVIGWVVFGAMVGGAWLGAQANETDPYGLVRDTGWPAAR